MIKNKVQEFGVYFAATFFVATIVFELTFFIFDVSGNNNLAYSTIRMRIESTLVELYAEDIWRNGHRTLETKFDPSICGFESKRKFLYLWSEVSCSAVDALGQTWIYTKRYRENLIAKVSIPIFIDENSGRELKIINKE